MKDKNHVVREIFRSRDVVYIPYRELVVAFRLSDAPDVMYELKKHGHMDVFLLKTLRAQADELYELTKRFAPIRPPGSVPYFLFDLICDVMNLFMVEYVLTRGEIGFLSNEAQSFLRRMRPISLSDAVNPSTRLETYLSGGEAA